MEDNKLEKYIVSKTYKFESTKVIEHVGGDIECEFILCQCKVRMINGNLINISNVVRHVSVTNKVFVFKTLSDMFENFKKSYKNFIVCEIVYNIDGECVIDYIDYVKMDNFKNMDYFKDRLCLVDNVLIYNGEHYDGVIPYIEQYVKKQEDYINVY